MNLIGFIMDNFFLVIIALWVLFSLFARSQKQPENQRNRETQQPSGQSRQRRIPQHQQTRQHQQREQEYRQPQSSVPDIPHTQPERMVKDSDAMVDTIPQNQSSDQSHPFDSQQLSKASVQGMMWKEVFGPPRSKDPFRTGRRTHR